MIIAFADGSSNARGHKEQHKDNQRAVNQHLVLAKLLEDLRDEDDDDGTDNGTAEGAHAAHQDHHQEHGGLVGGKGLRADEAHQVGIQGPADSRVERRRGCI